MALMVYCWILNLGSNNLRICPATRRNDLKIYCSHVYTLCSPRRTPNNSAFYGHHFCSRAKVLFILSHFKIIWILPVLDALQEWLIRWMVIFSPYAKVDTLCQRDIKIGVDAITFDQILNAWDECSVICLLLIQYGFICLSVTSLPEHVYDEFIYGWLSVLLSWKAICFVLPWASVLDIFLGSYGNT